MHDRTRQLLALLADELTQLVLVRCRDTAMSEPQLRDATGASHATLSARLALMRAHGLVRPRGGDSAGGRRPSVWEVANDDAVLRYSAAADAFALELLQQMSGELEDASRDRARRELNAADDLRVRGEEGKPAT